MNYTENYVYILYSAIGIDSSSLLNPQYLSETLGFQLFYEPQRSKCCLINKAVLLDSRVSLVDQLEDFYHEMAHYLLNHYPTRDHRLYNYMEGKADNLIPYLAIPLHLLNDVDLNSPYLIYELSEKFNVSYDIALKRVDQIKDRLIDERKVFYDEGWTLCACIN